MIPVKGTITHLFLVQAQGHQYMRVFYVLLIFWILPLFRVHYRPLHHDE